MSEWRIFHTGNNDKIMDVFVVIEERGGYEW